MSKGSFCAERLWIGFYFVEGPHKKRKNKELKMIPCKEYVEGEICIQLGEAMRKARYDDAHNTKVFYGYCKDDKNMRLTFNKEIVVNKEGNISLKDM